MVFGAPLVGIYAQSIDTVRLDLHDVMRENLMQVPTLTRFSALNESANLYEHLLLMPGEQSPGILVWHKFQSSIRQPIQNGSVIPAR